MKKEQFTEVMKQIETYIKNGQAMTAAHYVMDVNNGVFRGIEFTIKQYEKANHRVYEALKAEGHNI